MQRLKEEDRIITRIPAKINVNWKAQTLNELLAKRSDMHRASFKFLIEDVMHELLVLAKSHDINPVTTELAVSTGKIIQSIRQYLEKALLRHNEILDKALSEENFVEDATLENLAREMLHLGVCARSKLAFWFENDNPIDRSFYDRIPLENAHNFYISYLENKLSNSCLETQEKKETQLHLCKLKGLIRTDCSELDPMGRTPLIAAAQDGNGPADIMLLAEVGCIIDARDFGFKTALMRAAQNGHFQSVQALSDYKADVNAVDRSGWTAIMLACEWNKLEAVNILARLGADINAAAADGTTALMIATQGKHIKCIKGLLLLKADVTAKKYEGSDKKVS